MRQAAVKKSGLDEEGTEERHHLTFDGYEEGKLSPDEYLGVALATLGLSLRDPRYLVGKT